MPSVTDFPFRPWSTAWSLDFGPLYFEPPRPPEPDPPPAPVPGAQGGFVKLLSDQRPGMDSVRTL